MKNKRQILFFGEDFEIFYKKQSNKVRKRIDWTLGIIQQLDIIPEKYFKHIEGTRLYEIRIVSGSNIFRIFCFLRRATWWS